jgi:DNA-binding PadR family transcriptional regulator
MTDLQLGQFEQAVLIAVLREGAAAFALEVRRALEVDSGRPVSRGAFYTTVERLKRKGLLTWETVRPEGESRATMQRRFSVTPAGLVALRDAKRFLEARCASLEQVLGES